tara:strand:+ start:259 stop:1053 length:795 start_codon:yes stop_codon:yes gene_type:complete
MGFKKFLGGIIDDVKESIEDRLEEKNRRDRESDEADSRVDELLEKFEIQSFIEFLMKYLNQTPKPVYETDEKTGREHKINPSRKDYVDFIWDHLDDSEINYEQLKDYALKKRIVSPSFFGENENIQKEKNEFQEIIEIIDTEFEPEKINDEENFQSQIVVFLKAKLPDKKIVREITTKHGDRIDVLIEDKYALELKIPSDRTTLRNLGAQIEEYVEQYPNLCVVIYDDQEKNLTQTIEDYVDKYKQNYGVPSIIIRGHKGIRPQ